MVLLVDASSIYSRRNAFDLGFFKVESSTVGTMKLTAMSMAL